jgi:hypothetical protein
MDIKQFAKRPELVEIVIDDENIVKEYGEPITFWMRDFVDINTYFDFFKSQSDKGEGQLGVLLQKLILNDQGQPVMAEEEALPVDITIAALTKINETLGKSKTRSSIPATGIPQQ